MKVFDWSPGERKFVDKEGKEIVLKPNFSGTVTLELLTHIERLQYMNDLGINLSNGEMKSGDEVTIEILRKRTDIAKKHIKKIDLIRVSNGEKVNSVEQLEYDTDGGNLLIQLSNVITGGVSLGESYELS